MKKILFALPLFAASLFGQVTVTGVSPNLIVTVKSGNAQCVVDNSHFYYAYNYPGPTITQINYPVITCNDLGFQTYQTFTLTPPSTVAPNVSFYGNFRFGGDYIYWFLTPPTTFGTQYSLLVYTFHNGAFSFNPPILL